MRERKICLLSLVSNGERKDRKWWQLCEEEWHLIEVWCLGLLGQTPQLHICSSGPLLLAGTSPCDWGPLRKRSRQEAHWPTYQLISQQKLSKPEGNDTVYLR